MQVETLRPPQWAEVADTLAAAFYDDPVFGWLLPDAATRRRSLELFFAIEARRIVLRHGRSQGGVTAPGAALVLPQNAWRTPVGVQVFCGPRYAQIFGARLPRALAVLTHLERRHVREPHVYFPYIGVPPDGQGRGLGRAMMTPVLEQCDREGVPAYLEASNPRCAHLYERLGFVGIDEVTPRGSPPIRLMIRRPVR